MPITLDAPTKPQTAPPLVADPSFAQDVATWLKTATEARKELIWQRGSARQPVTDLNQLIRHIAVLGRRIGTWGILRTADNAVWAQAVVSSNGYVVEVNGDMGREGCYVRRVAYGGDTSETAGVEIVADRQREYATVFPGETLGRVEAAKVMWSWVAGAKLLLGFTLRQLDEGTS